MANEPRKPQIVPLAKIHDLPGVFIPKVQDKAYGGLVTSIQVSGVKEAVILRLREDGEYQLVDGYRRRRASELAKKKDIPALVYKMTLQEAIEYHKKVKGQPTLPVPGVLVNTPTETQEPLKGDKTPETEKKPEQTVPTAPGKKADEPAPKAEQPAPKEGKTPEAEKKPEQATPAAPGKKADEPAPKAEQPAPKEGKTPEAEKKPEQAIPAAPGKKADEPAPKAEQTAPKEGKSLEGEKKPEQTVPVAPGKRADEPAPKAEQAIPKEGKAPEEKKPEQAVPAAPGKKADEPAPKAEQTAPKEGKSPEAEKKPEQTIPAAPSKKADEPAPKAEQPAPKEGKTLEGEKKPETVVKAVGMAAKGPAGTQITQVFEDRLSPPDDKELKNLPTPKEGESYFIVLHPGYLEKSKFNTVSVDQDSEDYRELKKSIELNGVKDPVLTRINPDGGLEILSGQRRHMIARELNYPVPAIIQKIDDADAKILVSDGNLHRPKISTYDLSRTLRMKMEGMKQKAGRRKKGFTAEELNSDEKLAKEMGMSVSIFCVIPDSNDVSLNFLVGMLYTQAFQELYFQADKVHGGSLPIPVRLMFDEFANVALPDGYARLQATMRSRNVMATIILQNISQLKELFKDSWEGIIGNADAFVYLGGNEQSTHKYVSELLGKETIETRTSSQSRGRNGSYSQNFQQAGRELLTPDEVRMLDNRYALVLLRGEAPVIDEKYDLMRHPNIKLTADGGAAPYIHSPRCLYAEEDLDFIFTSLDDIEIIDEMEES